MAKRSREHLPMAGNSLYDKLLITGCGRSGTGYSAAALNALGIRCGHEEVFSPSSWSDSLQRAPDWDDSFVAEASWLAAPAISSLASEVLVIHQVRNPLAVIRSFIRIRFFQDPSTYRSFAEIHVPTLTTGTVLDRAIHYWIEWNALVRTQIELSGRPHLVQQLETLDSDTYKHLAASLGIKWSDEMQSLLNAVPRNTNTRGNRSEDHSIGWSELRSSPEFDRLCEEAVLLGYDPNSFRTS